MADTKELDLRTYYQSGDIWEQEIVKKAKRSRALAWFVTMIFAGITLLSLLALVMLVPLKTFEPYIVEVDKNTGYVEVKSGLTRPATLALADGRIVTGRVGVESGLIDAIGGEAEALDWLETERDVPEDLDISTVWPEPDEGFDLIGTFLNGQARAALGLPDGPITLDGLVSLWQVGSAS